MAGIRQDIAGSRGLCERGEGREYSVCHTRLFVRGNAQFWRVQPHPGVHSSRAGTCRALAKLGLLPVSGCEIG